MFLTKIELDPSRRFARKCLSSPQVMHAVIFKATGSNDGDGPGRVLWRVDRSLATSLYLLSPSEPDCSQIVQEAGTAGARARTLDYSPFLERLEAGQEWAFRLTANPSYSASRGQGVRGKRVGHITVEQQRQWLITRASGYGFELLPATIENEESDNSDKNVISVVVTHREHPTFGRRRPNSEKRDRVTISRTVYEGILRVVDADALRQALIGGIGRSKAYGCGLMTLARTSRG